MTLRILVVDDSPTDRETVVAFLKAAGHDVVGEASDGVEAVDRFRELSPDVVVMDLVMAEMNGTDAARAILALNPDARLVAMSGLSQPSVQAEAVEAGMVGFIPKPVEEEDVVHEIQDAMMSF